MYIMTSKPSPTESDIARHNGRSSSIDEEKVENLNIEDVEGAKQEERVRLSRFTKEEEEAVIRKLDWHLMPLIFVLYSFSVLDRSNLGNAKIAGMSKDIDIAGNRYAWLGTIFYISCKQLRSRYTTLLIICRHSVSMDSNGTVFPPHRWVAFAVLFLGNCIECSSCLH
jgi:hypothetical protein